MIHFHVTKEIFELIRKGEKDHEYREVKPSWEKKLKARLLPFEARIWNAYTKENIAVVVVSVVKVPTVDIPNDFYRSFIRTPFAFDVCFREPNQRRLA